MIDLHIHSNFSDGSLSPKEIISISKKQGLAAIAITDHDTIAGAKEALTLPAEGLEIIPGIELGIGRKDKFHILGLYLDISSASLVSALKEIATYRMRETIKLFRVLNSLGLKVSPDELLKNNQDLTTANVISLLVKKGYVGSKYEAQAKYLDDGQPASIMRHTLSPEEKISLIKKANGLAILAHPFLIDPDPEKVKKTILELTKLGLDGIEVYHSSQNQQMEEFLLSTAQEADLLITGGSDFHGELKPDIEIGKADQNRRTIPYSLLKELKGGKDSEPQNLC